MSSSYSSDFKDPTPSDFEEVKATHSALMSAAYFIQAYCKDYNDDFMQCKRENADPAKCALEGRKVSRCVLDL
jgi:NADH dehydrogenase (ubiquinone) 1 alpha subcomplex subunit 8